MNKRFIQTMILSLLIPCIACAIQWVFWDKLQPFTWILFYPALFFSAQVGGRWGGVAATLLSVLLVGFFFVEPSFSLQINRVNTNILYSMTIFILMGFLFSGLQENFRRGQQKLRESEFALRALNVEMERRVEADLSMVTERLNLSTTAAQIGIWDWDIQKHQLVWDDRMYKLYGVKKEEFPVAYEPWLNGVHPDDRDFSNEVSQQALHGEKEYDTEFRVLWPDESVHWLKANGQVFRDENGQAIRMVGVNYEITERKRLEESLRESEALFSKIFTDSPVAMSMGSLSSGKIIEVNEAWCSLTGFTREAALGHDTGELKIFDQEERSRLMEAFSNQGYSKLVESVLTTKNGGKKNILISSELITIQEKQFIIASAIDITDRKRAEEALREREQKLNTILNLLPVGVSILDQDRKVVYSNDTLGKILGTTKEGLLRGDYRSRKYLRADGSEKNTEEFASTRAFTERTELHDIVIGVVKEDGHTVWTSVSAAPVDFPDWKVVLVTVDLTERKQAEETLRLSEQKYEALFEKAAVPTALTKMPEGVFADVNEAFQTRFGYSREEIIGKTSVEIGMARSDERSQSYINLEKYGTLRDNEKHLFTKAREARIGIVNINKTLINGQEYFISTIHDVTERKQAEESLRQRTEELEQLLDILPEAIWISDDAECKVIHGNRFASELLGITEKDNISQSAEAPAMTLRQFSQGRELGPEELPMQVAARTGQPQLDFELQIGRPGDLTYTLLGGAVPLFDPAGRPRGVVAAFHDITERKQLEDELRRSNAELEQFAYVASHDLQEPLRAVAGMVQLLGQRYQGKLDERADEYIGHAVEASQRMQNLINDLLDYSRVGRFGKPIEPTAVESSLKTALANLQVSVQENQAQITHDPLPTILADPGQLTQVLQNLIGNALKFRGNSPPRIHIGAEKVERAWRIAVSDNGIGIEPQYFERIFLVFQRLHTRREYAGTGIGLSLCMKIIERHGGQIWVESQPGQGSTFYFTIPDRKL